MQVRYALRRVGEYLLGMQGSHRETPLSGRQETHSEISLRTPMAEEHSKDRERRTERRKHEITIKTEEIHN